MMNNKRKKETIKADPQMIQKYESVQEFQNNYEQNV